MKKLLCVVLSINIFLLGCAGKVANPVAIHQPGDVDKSCKTLRAEMFQAQNEIARLTPKSDKTGYNIAMGVLGLFLIIPLLFMDLKQGEKVEIEAYRQRYNYLMLLAQEKNCKLTYASPTETEEAK